MQIKYRTSKNEGKKCKDVKNANNAKKVNNA